MCDEYGINFECKVDFSRYDFLDMADFCTILSNLLDNAIEACLNVENSDRYIKISNSVVNNFGLLIVENSKENIGKLGLITYYDSSTPESDDLTNYCKRK